MGQVRHLNRKMTSKVTSFLLVLSLGTNLYLWGWSGASVDRHTRVPIYAEQINQFNGSGIVNSSTHGVLAGECVTTGDEDNDVCKVFSSWYKGMSNLELRTNLKDWTFQNKVICPEFSTDTREKERIKISIDCKSSPVKIVPGPTNSSNDIFRIPFGDPCLVSAIENCCKDKKPVPNVVHYVWYSDRELGYFQFLSFMSVLRFMKPCLIILHGNYIPRGKYWDYFVSISPNVINVQRERPSEVFDRKFAFQEHASDIMRIEGLMMYGGLYLDFDEILLRSPEPLRKYEFTMGHELSYSMGSQFIMATRNAPFLRHWYLSYRDDYKKIWAYNAVLVPNKIAKSKPGLIHVEGYNFTRPDWKNVKQIFKENYDWSTNYGMHMYIRWYKNETDINIVRTLNTTIGAVSRHMLLGNKELCIK